jgi:hypothetical protein
MHNIYRELINKTLIYTEVDKKEDKLILVTSDEQVYQLFHENDSSEYVIIESISGDLNDLIGIPILEAEEVSNIDTKDLKRPELPKGPYSDDYTDHQWSFYKFGTHKGSVTVRFYGESNGCYATDATLKKLEGAEAEKVLNKLRNNSIHQKIEELRQANSNKTNLPKNKLH